MFWILRELSCDAEELTSPMNLLMCLHVLKLLGKLSDEAYNEGSAALRLFGEARDREAPPRAKPTCAEPTPDSVAPKRVSENG